MRKRYWLEGEDRPRCGCHDEPMVSPSGWRCARKMQRNSLRCLDRKANRAELIRKRNLFAKYGLTVEQYEELVAAHGGECAICAKRTKLVIDHDHSTGTVRGLLCNNCNTGLGMFEDGIANLMQAAEYLVLAEPQPAATSCR